MEDNGVGLDRTRRLHRRAQGDEGLLPYLDVAAREIDEVEGMARHRFHLRLAAPRAKALELFGCVFGRLPLARTLGEHLDGVPAYLLDAVDRLRDAACRGDMSAEEHRSRLMA